MDCNGVSIADGDSVLSLMKESRGSCLREKFVVVIVRGVLIDLGYFHRVLIIRRDFKSARQRDVQSHDL